MAKREIDFGKAIKKVGGVAGGRVASAMLDQRLNESMNPILRGLIFVGAGAVLPDLLAPKSEIAEYGGLGFMVRGIDHLLNHFGLGQYIAGVNGIGKTAYNANEIPVIMGNEIPLIASSAFESERIDFVEDDFELEGASEISGYAEDLTM